MKELIKQCIDIIPYSLEGETISQGLGVTISSRGTGEVLSRGPDESSKMLPKPPEKSNELGLGL